MTDCTVISVIMGVYNGAVLLPETIDSVLVQTERDFEFIIVDDGSTDVQVETILADYVGRDSRIQVISKSNEGLTRALIDGCAAAKGKYIARIDVGDTMLPNRLEKQRAVLDKHPDVVLVTCWTECCGPEWEHLYTTKSMTSGAEEGITWVANVIPERDGEDLIDGPTSHPSAMFRTSAYHATGGYRSQFYYGQDWDLWYRLAERGKFAGVQDLLYRCRIFPDGISMQNPERQRQIHACSRGAFCARRRGESEEPFLQCAVQLRPMISAIGKRSASGNRSAGCYFIGEALRGNMDMRCQHYLRMAVVSRPWMVKGWLRLAQGLLMQRQPMLPLSNGNQTHLAIIVPNCCQGSVGAVAWRHALELSRWFYVHILSESIPPPPNERIHAIPLSPSQWNYLRRFCHVPNALSFELAARRRLDTLCRTFPISTVWCHGHASVVLAAFPLQRRHGFRILMTTHGDIRDRPAGTYSRELTWYYQMVTGPAYRRADTTHAISPYMAELARSGGAREVRLIPHGIDLADIGLRDLPVRAMDSYCPEGVVRLLYVGNLLPVKGIEVLLRAMVPFRERNGEGCHVRGDGMQVRLCLVGGGSEQSRYEQLAVDLGVEKLVHFHGAVARTDLGHLYASSDALCVPSLSESLSLAGLEGMICGLPVIGSQTGGLSYIVDDTKTGRLSAPGDVAGLVGSILDVCQSRERLASLGQAAQQRALAHFTWTRISEQIRDLVLHEQFPGKRRSK